MRNNMLDQIVVINYFGNVFDIILLEFIVYSDYMLIRVVIEMLIFMEYCVLVCQSL